MTILKMKLNNLNRKLYKVKILLTMKKKLKMNMKKMVTMINNNNNNKILKDQQLVNM